jgi:hypothetical protein
MRTVTNCLAFENALLGFQHVHSESMYDFSSILYNNTAYNNGWGKDYNFSLVATGTQVMRNNISYLGGAYVPSGIDDQYNSWDTPPGVTVVAADFISVSSTGMDGARGTGGTLPVTDFLRLSATSDLIDAGIDVGLDYNGTAPDLGAFEKTIQPNLDDDPDVEGVIKYNGLLWFKSEGKLIHVGVDFYVITKEGLKVITKNGNMLML